MKISSFPDNINSRKRNTTFGRIPPNPVYIPEVIGKIGKLAGKYIDSPEQRLFLALGTLMFKPAIDLKFAKEDKKVDSALKSTSKALAGGITGVTIRAVFLHIANKYIGYEYINDRFKEKATKLNRFFLPRIPLEDKLNYPEIVKLNMQKYTNTIGSLFAILFMVLYSNSNIDVPLTNDIQDVLSGVVKNKKSWLQSIGEVSTARKNKFINWFKNKKDFIERIIKKTKDVINILNNNYEENGEIKK